MAMKLKTKIQQYLGINTPQNKKDFLLISLVCISIGLLLSFGLSLAVSWQNTNSPTNNAEPNNKQTDRVESIDNKPSEVYVNTSFLAVKTAESLLHSKQLSEYEIISAMVGKGFGKNESMAAVNLFNVNFSDRALSTAINILERNSKYVSQNQLKTFLTEKYLFNSKDVDLAISKIDYEAYSKGKNS